MSVVLASTAMPAATPSPYRFAWLRIPFSAAVAIILALSPITAILVLGWLVRLMRREVAIAVLRERLGINRSAAMSMLASRPATAPLAPWTGWLRASSERKSWAGRRLGGLVETARAGLAASLVLALATLPFTALLLLSWWAGWENSFNKGYEQAWVGPSLAILGIGIALFVLPHLPMGLAHFAAERRFSAMFELPTLRALIRARRWRTVWLALVAMLACLPIALARILPVFIENLQPGFADLPPDLIEAAARNWHVLPTVYLVLALILLRRAQARCYARAALTLPLEKAPFCHAIAEQFDPGQGRAETRASKRTLRGALISTLLLLAIWFAFIAQLYVAQFANHGWWNWLNHPLIGLPWVYRPL